MKCLVHDVIKKIYIIYGYIVMPLCGRYGESREQGLAV